MDYPIRVNYEYTSNIYQAKKWLEGLPDLIACDFEAASKFTKQQKDVFKNKLDNYKLTEEERRVLLQSYLSNGLSHPSLTCITHFSVAWSNRDSYVVICPNDAMRIFIYNFLINTSKTQIWHNSIYDFKHIYYHTGVLPKHYIDTLLVAKSLLNNANPMRDKVNLKDLMGYKYGAWGLSKDEDKYTLENMFNPEMIEYAATDSPATYGLYEDIKEDLKAWKI